MPRPSLCLNIPKTGSRFTRRFFDAADWLELRRRCGLGRLAAPNRASVEIVKRIKRYGPGWGNLNSPEVLAGRPAEDADDVWSLCVVLHEIVAGRQPFAGGAPEAVLRRIRGQRLAAGAPPSAVLAFATAILTAPRAGRPASVPTFAAALAAVSGTASPNFFPPGLSGSLLPHVCRDR